MSEPLLQIENLHLSFNTGRGEIEVLNGINIEVLPGEIFGIVGETGCGKTVTGLSILGLLPTSATIPQGRIMFEGQNLLDLSPKEMRAVRGSEIAMIFQDPSSSLNPVFSIGKQITRIIRRHLDLNKNQAAAHAMEMLDSVGLPEVQLVMDSYPHQLSGGMQQRVMIALALACNPKLLIADEPTTALDVTIQAQILKLLKDLQKKLDISVILITHNLGVVANTCDRLAVLYAGRVAEIGSTKSIFGNPQHIYTQGLLEAIPRPAMRGSQMTAIPGSVPSNPGNVVGCAFAPRCKHAFTPCFTTFPELFAINPQHDSACFLGQKDDE